MIKNKYPNIKPSLNLDFANTKTLDSRVMFRRGTPGAYYDGKTHVKAEENLIANSTVWSDSVPWDGSDSSNSNSGWNFINTTVHDNQPSPDGTNTAYKVSPTDSSTTTAIWPGVSKSTEAHTFSVYVKMDSPDYTAIALYWNSSGTTHARFNLVTGQVTLDQGSGRIQASMHDVGDGWWRCVATHSNHSSTNATMYVLVDDTNASNFARWNETDGPDGVKGLLMWHPQIEAREFVTAYTPTTGIPVTKYQPQLMFASTDQPRFDHDPITGESKGLLIEEQRTNMHRRSEDFTSADHVNFVGDMFSNQAIAPDGQYTATSVVMNAGATSGGWSTMYRPVVTAGLEYTFSIHIKPGDFTKFLFGLNPRLDTGGDNGSLTFTYNFDTHTVEETSGLTSSFVQSIGNGWYRAEMSGVLPANSTKLNTFVYIEDSVAGAGNDTYYVWGSQLEQGSFSTSYIKTSGASATRSADNASITGENFSSWYRQDEGAIDIDFKYYHKYQANDTVLSLIGDNGYVNIYQFTSNPMLVVRAANNTTSFNAIMENPYIDGSINRKISFSYSAQGLATCLNAGDVISSDLAIHGHDTLYVGQNSAGMVINGHIKKLSYYPQRLTNEQLQNLTR